MPDWTENGPTQIGLFAPSAAAAVGSEDELELDDAEEDEGEEADDAEE